MAFTEQNVAGTAVVTGASAGIGACYAYRLAERGHDLVLVARRADRLDEAAATLRAVTGTGIETLVADLARAEGRNAVARRLAEPDVTLLVNNAGINGYGPFAEVDPGLLARIVDLNVTTPTLLARAAIPGMLTRGRGAVVNVASLLAFSAALPPEPLPYRATYAATKSYVVTFTRTLAAELAGTPLTFQVLCPGYTATEFHLSNGVEPVDDVAASQAVHAPTAMTAEDVVTASLAALDVGELICAPGLADPTAIERLTVVESELRAAGVPELAARYRPGD